MSKKPKHVFTCPDVIYLQQRSKKKNRNALIGLAIFYTVTIAGGWMASSWIEKNEKKLQETPDAPDDL
jgi:hypothetical protein